MSVLIYERGEKRMRESRDREGERKNEISSEYRRTDQLSSSAPIQQAFE